MANIDVPCTPALRKPTRCWRARCGDWICCSSTRSTEQGTLFSGCRRRHWNRADGVVQDRDRALGLGESLPLLVPRSLVNARLQVTVDSHSPPSNIAIATSTQPSLLRGKTSPCEHTPSPHPLPDSHAEYRCVVAGKGQEGSSNFTWLRPAVSSDSIVLWMQAGLSAVPPTYLLPYPRDASPAPLFLSHAF